MSLKDYPELTLAERALQDFQINGLHRRTYRLVLKGDQQVTGVPTAVPGTPGHFTLHTIDGVSYKIPFADLETADAPEADDHTFMKMALDESRKCIPEHGKDPGRVPKVGAVLVLDGRVVGKAYRNEQVEGSEPGDHAEMILLERKLENEPGISRATLYTTLEPCCSERKHPNLPCTSHISGRRIIRVVIGMLDPNQKICGKGVWMLREAGIDVGLCDTALTREIEDLNRGFVRAHRKQNIPDGSPTVASSAIPEANLEHADLAQLRPESELWIRRATLQIDRDTKRGLAAIIDLGATYSMKLELDDLSVGLQSLTPGTQEMWLSMAKGDTLTLKGNTLTARPMHLRQSSFDAIANDVWSNRVVQVVLAGRNGHTIVRSDGLGYEVIS